MQLTLLDVRSFRESCVSILQSDMPGIDNGMISISIHLEKRGYYR